MKRKLLLLALLFAFMSSFSNPMVEPPVISEIYLNGNTIQIEFYFEWWWYDNFDELYLVSSTDTVAFVNGIEIIPNEIMVLDQDDLVGSFEYNPEGDQIYLIDNDFYIGYYEYENFRFGNFPGAKVPAPNENQSIAFEKVVEIGYNEAYYYVGLEETPTIGSNEFHINARGVLKGTFLDLNGNPIPDVEVSFPYYDPPVYPSFSDVNGSFVMTNLLAANYDIHYFWGDFSDFIAASIFPLDTTIVEIQIDTLLQDVPEYYNYPNPFSGSTSFNIQIPDNLNYNSASVCIYNMSGRLVDRIEVPQGYNSVDWRNIENEPGVYLYNLLVDNKKYTTQKMIIL